jgi:hypothetical protein
MADNNRSPLPDPVAPESSHPDERPPAGKSPVPDANAPSAREPDPNSPAGDYGNRQHKDADDLLE